MDHLRSSEIASELTLPRGDSGEAHRPWPERIVEQLAALQEVLANGPATAADAAERSRGASRRKYRRDAWHSLTAVRSACSALRASPASR